MSVPVLDLLAALQARLAPVAPSLDDEKSLTALDSPPRLVWVLRDGTTSAPKGTGHPAAPEVPTIFWDAWRYEVHVWAETKDATFELRRCLLKAYRECLGGLARVGKTTAFGGDTYNVCGWVLVVELWLPAPVFDEPIGVEPSTATGTAIAKEVVFEIPIGTAGDGGLTTGAD